MDSMFALSVVDSGIELRSGQTKDTAHSIKEKEQRLVSPGIRIISPSGYIYIYKRTVLLLFYHYKNPSKCVSISSAHQNVICSRHDIAKECSRHDIAEEVLT